MADYTLADLEAAKAALAAWEDRFDRYTGNNPDKYRSDIESARAKIRTVEAALKANGSIPLTEQELLERELDAAFPDAKSKEVVEFQGSRFQRRFWPVSKSRAGNVQEWGRGWTKVE